MLSRGVEGHHLGHVGLNEDDAALRVQVRRQPVQHHLIDVGLNLPCILRRGNSGEGVDVHGTVDTFVAILEVNPVLERTQVVAEMKLAGGAHSREIFFLSVPLQ